MAFFKIGFTSSLEELLLLSEDDSSSEELSDEEDCGAGFSFLGRLVGAGAGALRAVD